MTEKTQKPTATLPEVIRAIIEKRLSEVHILLPGQIESVDVTKGTADVKPLLKRKYSFDDVSIELPIIPSVPIVWPRFGECQIRIPIKKGDYCRIQFAERSLDAWIQEGGTIDPEDPRKFHLSDAVCLPGLYPLSDTLTSTSNQNSLEIRNGKTPGGSVIEMTPNGKFRIGNDTTELFKNLSDLISTLETAKVPTLAGPQTFLPTDIAKLAVIRGKIEEITKG